ncbi:MAG: galactonate dehydratase, partial [Actinobacteria bacterium]|nr:galactonate dehydratase [Actinomycetota bacterium]MSY21312.1 galactonate dehydratase [Actinomycetota bacterium]
MKITNVTTTIVNANMRNWVIVRVYTDVPGLIGIGEATVEFQAQGVAGVIADLSPLIIGKDPREIERLWQIIYRHPFFKGGVVTMSALSGIDQALWDISAKDLGVPLWRILGGLARDRVRMYDHLGGGDSDAVYNSDTAQSFGAKMKKSIDDGFTAVKILAVPQSAPLGGHAGLRHAEELMGAARDAAGPDVDIMIDFHGRTTAAMAIQYARVLEPFNPLFLEEVVQPDQHEALVRARKGINVPLATGERLLTRSEFLPILKDGLIDVAQPDVCHAGGITELRKISNLCETFGVLMAPHNPLGPIATMVNVHMALTTPNFLIQEVMRADVPWRTEVFQGVPEIKDGHLLPPTGLGIGVEIDENAASKHPFKAVTPVQW